MDDAAPFQEENNDNPPTLSHLNMDEEISIDNELADELIEHTEFRVDEDEVVEKEDEEDETNMKEQELEAL